MRSLGSATVDRLSETSYRTGAGFLRGSTPHDVLRSRLAALPKPMEKAWPDDRRLTLVTPFPA